MDAKQLSILFNKAKEFAKSQGFNHLKFDRMVNEHVIYYIQETDTYMGCTGYPLHIIIAENIAPRILLWEEYRKIHKGV